MKSYKFIVGIDFGANSTSFSFAHFDDKNNIESGLWTGEDNFLARVASSVLYRQEDDVPLWGKDANKKNYGNQTDFFYASRVKLYLTDYENQPPIPGTRLTPIKLVSDYLYQAHKHILLNMREYLQETGHPDNNLPLITNDQICYVFSCPDDQKNTDYQVKIKNALKMAGIITPNDPKDKLRFITESEATAFFLTTLSKEIKVSPDPYLVCSVGDTLGLSTVEMRELPEAAKVSFLEGQASITCVSLQLDSNMRKYLKDNVTSSPENSHELEILHDHLFELYIENIKPSFSDYSQDYYFDMRRAVVVSETKIISRLIDGDTFVFPYKDMKTCIFDPVTSNILHHIEIAISKCNRLTGVFIFGAIGYDKYLEELVHEKFDIAVWTNNNPYGVSEALVAYGAQHDNVSVPYFIYKEIKQKSITRIPGNEGLEFTEKSVKEIKHSNVDYVIGLDFGELESSIAFAPTSIAHRNKTSSFATSIRDAIPSLGSSSTPSILYYSSRMKHQNKFGDYVQKESDKKVADGILLRYFKPLVTRYFDPNGDDKSLKEIDDFQLVDAISNYIKDLNREGLRQIERQLDTTIDKNKLIYVIPVPHEWPEEAKNTMMTAIKNADLVNPEYFDERVTIITDAEAITCHCQFYFPGKFSMENGHQFMICNIQERNISLTTFQVIQKYDQNDLILSEITSSSSDDSAHNWIDQKFKEFIINQLESSAINYTESGLKSIENYFTSHIKPNFISGGVSSIEDDIKIPVPLEFGIPFDFNDPTGLIVDDCIVIPNATAKSELFKPTVDAVLEKITKELNKLPKGDRQIDAILVTGIFSLSAFLYKHIRYCFENSPVGTRFVGKPLYHQLAISRGAVSFGLESRLVSESFSRYNYFLQVRDIYRHQIDDPEQRVVGYDGQEYCENIFSEIIKKGSKITKGIVCIQRVFVTYPNDLILAVYSSDEEIEQKTPQQVIASLKSALKVQVEIPETPKFKEGDRIEFEIWFQISGWYMDIDVHYEGKVCKHDVIKIDIITKEKYPTTSKTLWRPIIGPQSVPMPMSAPIPKPLSAPIPLSERMHMRMPMPMPMPMPTPTPHNGKGPFFSDISSSQTRETTGLLHDELDEFEFIV